MSRKSKKAPVARVCCPQCEREFKVTSIAGGTLDRHCPLCGDVLVAGAYDARAKEVISELAVYEASRTSHDVSARRWARRGEWLARLRFSALEGYAKRIEIKHHRAYSKDMEAISRCSVRLSRLAESRYYTSEWYLCSGITLHGPSPSRASYRVQASYDSDGTYVLTPQENIVLAKSTMGEKTVFDEIASAACAGVLPGSSRLVPNVYLPSEDDSCGGMGCQTDLIILTSKAAVVCEVKRWEKHVNVANRDGWPIISAQTVHGANGQRWRKDPKPIKQMRQRMESFAGLGSYPADRVFGAVVFVDALSFEASEGSLQDKMLVCSCERGGGGTFIPALLDVLATLDDLYTPEQVDALAEKMLIGRSKRTGALVIPRCSRQEDKVSRPTGLHISLAELMLANIPAEEPKYTPRHMRGLLYGESLPGDWLESNAIEPTVQGSRYAHFDPIYRQALQTSEAIPMEVEASE